MRSHPISGPVPGLSLLIVMLLFLSGCTDEVRKSSISAFSAKLTAEEEMDRHDGSYHLAVVTGLEPEVDGRCRTWKFTYIDQGVLQGPRSLTVLVDEGGLAGSEPGDLEGKIPVMNWTVDSTSAYDRAVSDLVSEGAISGKTPVKVVYIYLLGNMEKDSGCHWFIGLILGSDSPLEVQYRIDGRTGEVLK